MRRGRLQLGQGKNAAPNYASALAMLDLNFGKSLVTIRNPTIGNLYRTRFQLFDFLTAKQHIQLHPHHLRQPTCRFRGVFTVLSRFMWNPQVGRLSEPNFCPQPTPEIMHSA